MPRMQGYEENALGDLENPDGLAVPSPVEGNKQRSWPSSLERVSADSNGIGDRQYDSEAGEYDPPYEYENLDELKAPSPVQSTQVGRPQGYLEDHRSSFDRSDRVRGRGRGRGRGRESRERSRTDGRPAPKHQPAAKHEASDKHREKKSSPSARHHFSTELYTISHLIFFSILGTLARLGLQALTFYPGAPVQFSVLWPNVAGSLIIGFLLEDRKIFSELSAQAPSSSTPPFPQNPHNDEDQPPPPPPPSTPLKQQYASLKKTIPLYVGLATGFCGSLTSFSSFIRDAFLALANALPMPISHTSATPIDPTSTVRRNGGYSVMALLAVIITTVALCLSALITGAHLATVLHHYTPSIPYIVARRFLDRGVVFLAWGSWLGAIVMAIWPPDRAHAGPAYRGGEEHWRGQAIFAVVFAPLGCLLRFYLAVHQNGRIASFPMGTFAVNILGTALEGVFWDLQHSESSVGGGLIGCQVLQGMMDGFCGAATT
ncbi:MAG: hypothetical protein Q9196_004110, partial [Gyalolechia fulgens]